MQDSVKSKYKSSKLFDISREFSYSPWEKWIDFHSLKENWPQGNLRWNIFLSYESWRSHVSLHCISREFQRDKTLTFLFSKYICMPCKHFAGFWFEEFMQKISVTSKNVCRTMIVPPILSCLFRHPCAVLFSYNYKHFAEIRVRNA